MNILLDLRESNTLLAYGFTTIPAPVQVSPASGDPGHAVLVFVISAARGEVQVSRITVSLPVGDPSDPDSADLTDDPTGIGASVRYSGEERWSVGPGAAPGSYVIQPSDGEAVTISSQALTVVLSNVQVSKVVGTAMVDVVEVATDDRGPPQPRRMTIAVAKFPHGFFAGEFSAQRPAVQNGQPAVLSWIGSEDAEYTMLWATHAQDVTRLRRWTSPPLEDVTTFILQVQAQVQGQTVTLRFSTTVIVAQPSISAHALTVATTSALRGAVEVGQRDAPANLAVNGGVTVSGAMIAAGSLQATGPATLAGTSVSNLTVSGALATAAASISGALQALGGPVSIFHGARSISGGSYAAGSDGFVVATVGFAEDAGGMCSSIIWGWNNGVQYFAAGGNQVIQTVPGLACQWGASNSFVMVVQKGSSFVVSVYNCPGNQEHAPVSFWWIPLGSGGDSAWLQQIEEPAEAIAARPRLPAPVCYRI